MATFTEMLHPQGNGVEVAHVADDQFEAQFVADAQDIAELNDLDRDDEWFAELDHFQRVVFGDRAL